jgi:hypothetical protein
LDRDQQIIAPISVAEPRVRPHGRLTPAASALGHILLIEPHPPRRSVRPLASSTSPTLSHAWKQAWSNEYDSNDVFRSPYLNATDIYGRSMRLAGHVKLILIALMEKGRCMRLPITRLTPQVNADDTVATYASPVAGSTIRRSKAAFGSSSNRIKQD